VLSAECGEIRALCDEIIAQHCFDENTPVWEESELKSWLQTTGRNLVKV
jgi:hypothetical protein